jgi:hypothetical protein
MITSLSPRLRILILSYSMSLCGYLASASGFQGGLGFGTFMQPSVSGFTYPGLCSECMAMGTQGQQVLGAAGKNLGSNLGQLLTPTRAPMELPYIAPNDPASERFNQPPGFEANYGITDNIYTEKLPGVDAIYSIAPTEEDFPTPVGFTGAF